MTKHILYKDGDENIPNSIKDQNGSVVLGMCKVCGAAEVQLIDYPDCDTVVEMKKTCMCGGPVDGHTIEDGHNPVSEWEHYT